MEADVVIAGAGLAGACAALALAGSCRVVVLDDGVRGASHAAAGLVNPFMGRKATRVWRADDALAALAATVDEIRRPELFQMSGLLRPARDARQAEAFRQRAEAFPEALDWWTPDTSAARWPEVVAPQGALWVREGGHVEIPELVAAVLAEAERRGAEVVPARLAEWSDADATPHPLAPRGGAAGAPRRQGGVRPLTLWTSADADAVLSRGERGPRDTIQADRLLLCTGDGTRALAPSLPLHRVKGQTVRLAAPVGVEIPAVSGPVYVVPVAPGEVVVGATFEHAFSSLDPTPEATDDLRQRASVLVPALEGAALLEARAGVRLTVPASVRPGRLPLLGPLRQPRVWVFSGLGAKGLLTAPLLAHHLAAWWDAPESIWPEVSTLPLSKNP